MKITLSEPVVPPRVLEVTEDEYEIIRKALNRYAQTQRRFADSNFRCGAEVRRSCLDSAHLAETMRVAMFTATKL